MKFSCEKALLQAAISTTSRAVSPKSSIPALEGILLEAGSDLRLTGYNLETGIRTIVPADIREEGTLVLGARLFGEIVRKLPDDIVTFQSENYMVNIKCGMSEFNILGTDPEEFPELPTVEYQNSLILPQSRLKAMISQTLFAVSDNESRPIHTGSLFEVDSEGLTIVSVDGYRLALRHESIDKKEGAETFSFVVPGAALSEVEKICSDVDEPASVTQGARHVMFKVGDTMLVSRRLEGEFLAYRQAIPRNNTIHVEGDTRALLSSIDRVSLIISDKLKSPLRCVFGDRLQQQVPDGRPQGRPGGQGAAGADHRRVPLRHPAHRGGGELPLHGAARAAEGGRVSMEIKPYLRRPQFYETDGMSIIWHGNYVRWMEEARTDFMDQLGFPYARAVEAGIDFALTDISCKYRAMTRFGEELAITVFIRRLSPAKLELGYEMREASTGELKAEGTSGHFFYDRAKGRPVALKKALPEVYRLLEALTTPD